MRTPAWASPEGRGDGKEPVTVLSCRNGHRVMEIRGELPKIMRSRFVTHSCSICGAEVRVPAEGSDGNH